MILVKINYLKKTFFFYIDMDKILELYSKFGDSEYLGEDVSKTVHMIQAAHAAEKNNEPDYVVLACLLHDIGHFLENDNMNGLGVIEHGKVAGDYLRELGMYEKVCILVENHVTAKRYLVSKNDDYYEKLSDASKKTLEYQGGRMSSEEMRIFEENEDFRDILRIRYYDDNGKKVGVEIPDLNHYHDLIKKYLNKYRNDLEENGYVLIKDFFNDTEAEEINNFRLELEELEEHKGKWMIYYEENNGNKLKSRIENFVNYKDNIKNFVDTKIKSLLESLLYEKVILFKEKINWKLPGGNGFKAHQDHPAWNDFNISKFYSVAIFGNNSTIENGCLQVSPQKNNQLFNDNGCISENIANSLDWKYVESTSKDLLIFDSFIPHKSDKNNSSKSRSIFYFTFNKLDEGNHYEKYVENKRKYFPPENERNNQNIDLDNNKYNLGNPLK